MESIVLELLNKQNEKLSEIERLLTISKTVQNIDEVSFLTGLSKSTIYKMTCAGLIPHYKQSKHLYFDKAEIEAWLKTNKIKTKDEIEKEASSYVTLNRKGGQK